MFYACSRIIMIFIQTMLFAILKLLKTTAVILLLLAATHKAKFLKNCALRSLGDTSVHLKHGDVMLAGIVQLSYGTRFVEKRHLFSPPKDQECIAVGIQYLRHFLALDFAIEEINKNPNILPNITLGYDVYDTCHIADQAMQATMRALSGGVKNHWNYRCGDNGQISAFIGHLIPTSSLAISQMLSLYGYPQISYGDIFNNNIKFPFFYHTAQGPNVVNKAIIKLLKYFGWTWIGIISETNLKKASEDLMEEILKSGICVEYIYIPTDVTAKVSSDINRSRSSVIIINYPLRSCAFILHLLLKEHSKTIILTSDILTSECILDDRYLSRVNGTLFFVSQKGNIIGLKEVIHNANPVVYQNKILKSLWYSYFECVPPDNKSRAIYWCKKNYTLTSLPNIEYYVENFRTTYSVYLAVYAVAHALNNMYMANSKQGKHNGSFIQRIHPKQLNRFIRNIHFQTPSGDDIVFGEKGISNKGLELINVAVLSNKTLIKESVGGYDPNASERDRFFIKKDYIKWAENVREKSSSSCFDNCFPGYRKHQNKQKHCCYFCVPCSAETFSNDTDMEECEQCPEDEWPNSGNTACVKRPVNVLYFNDLFGSLLTSLIVILFVFSIIILIIFFKYRETPIVKANNRNLSYTILISLMLCFLCSLLFIGNPDKMTCLLQNISFNIVFAIAVSSILAKTIIVLIAFNVTKSKRRLSILLLKIPHVFIISCLIGEFSICACWICFYPPYPDRDSVSQPGILILYCNVGSHVIYYLALGYNSFLALLCFLVAYFVKKLPDRFNEAYYITFSMLVFCSVWISFIPAYISTKGKYMTAVQVFAILASSSGLLGFIFIPKCFIILFRPELNVKKSPYIKS